MNKMLAVVTGGSGYIGGAIVKEFQKNDWNVVDISRSSAEFPCDITDKEVVQQTVADIVKKYGAISACIHAAAYNDPARKSGGKNVLNTSVAIAQGGAENLLYAALPHMVQGGAFIGITTQLIEPEHRKMQSGAYVESKDALRNFLRKESLGQKNIRVYAVAPGYLPGGLNKDAPKAVIEMLARKTSKTEQSPEFVSSIVVGLAEGKKAPPSGTSINVDGEVVSPL